MRKRYLNMLGTVMIACALTGCGEKSAPAVTVTEAPAEVVTEAPTEKETEEPAETATEENPYRIFLEEIRNDVRAQVQVFETELKQVHSVAAVSYKDYLEHEDMLLGWYNDVLEESEVLFVNVLDRSVDYFLLVADHAEELGRREVDDLMDLYFDCIYEDTMADYFEGVYEDLMADVFDTYYEGVVAEGQKQAEFSEWLDVSSDCYSDWLDAGSDIYSLWLDAGGEVYKIWLEVGSDFFMEDYDKENLMEIKESIEKYGL